MHSSKYCTRYILFIIRKNNQTTTINTSTYCCSSSTRVESKLVHVPRAYNLQPQAEGFLLLTTVYIHTYSTMCIDRAFVFVPRRTCCIPGTTIVFNSTTTSNFVQVQDIIAPYRQRIIPILHAIRSSNGESCDTCL